MDPVEQAGGIVVRFDGPPLLLVATGKRSLSRWIFPKGHIEEGETPVETAIREVREETGIETKLLPPGYLGTTEFNLDLRNLRVQYFLLQYTGTSGPGDGRLHKWCTYDAALALLTFENTRELLRRVLPVITAQSAH